MISKNKAKFMIRTAEKKKRDEENLDIIEGDNLVREFLKADQRPCKDTDSQKGIHQLTFAPAEGVYW